MPVENTDGLRWSKAKFPKDPFRLLLCLRLNARVDDCSFHCIIVSLSQHRCKVFFLISIFSSFVQHLLYIAASYRKEVSENQGSSLLNNIFSTILNLAPLQKDVWSVLGKDLPEDRPSVLFTEIRLWRINSHSGPWF